jgi:uncharacterized repeat protein (TIGR01451 family)
VFVRTGSTWNLEQKITASDAAASNFFGSRVSIDSDTIVVGSDGDLGGVSTGSAYVFVRSTGTWTEEQKLTASDAAADDNFGAAVAVAADTIVVGAHRNDDAGLNSGSAYVFFRTSGTWSEQQKLTASDAGVQDNYGNSVGISGETIIIGSTSDDDPIAGNNAGSAYVYSRSGATWSETDKLTASDIAASDSFGVAVAMDGERAVIGANNNDDGGSSSGAAYVFGPPPSPSADLAITKTSSPAEARIGQNLTYTLTVTNNGPNVANSITVTDTLPGAVTFVSAPGECTGTTTVTCTAASLASSANVQFTITVHRAQHDRLHLEHCERVRNGGRPHRVERLRHSCDPSP